MNRVVLSSTMSDIYDFFLPISARIWRTRIGYEPLVFLVGTMKEWTQGHCGVVLWELDRAGYHVEMVDHVPWVPDGNVSMSIRQHAAALGWLDEKDIVLVGDIDLFPLRRNFYHQNDLGKHPIVIYHAGMYNDRYWPAYGPAMSVSAWREVMGLETGDLRASLLKTFRDGDIEGLIAAKNANYKDSRIWTFDEEYASARIRSSRFYDGILRVGSSNEERLCRNSWPDGARADKYIDGHCPRPGWSAENWPKIRALLSQVMPEDLSWLDQYVTEYRAK
jgi:hypothetical protein